MLPRRPGDDGSLSQTAQGHGDWWLYSRYILKVEKTKFSDILSFSVLFYTVHGDLPG